MKKIIFISFLFFISCGNNRPNLNNRFMLSPGMTKVQVLETIGKPLESEFDRNVEEWFYCNLLWGGDYLSLFFENGILVKTLNYTVKPTWEKGGEKNSDICTQNFKKGTYRVPDEILEIRLKVD